jgi:hypothetical protein
MEATVKRREWERKLREVAAKLGRITFTDHAKKRDPKAGKKPIDVRTAQACLLKGVVTEDPSLDIKLANGWKGKVSRDADGVVTEVACVLVLDEENGDWILVITGYQSVSPRSSGRRRPNRNS